MNCNLRKAITSYVCHKRVYFIAGQFEKYGEIKNRTIGNIYNSLASILMWNPKHNYLSKKRLKELTKKESENG